MTQSEINSQFDELVDQILGFYSRKPTEHQGKQALIAHREEMLKAVVGMEHLERFPVYGALAFIGRFRFIECSEVRALAQESSSEILEAIRAKKAISIEGAEAQQKWLALRDQNPECACSILSLCFLASKSTKTRTKIP